MANDAPSVVYPLSAPPPGEDDVVELGELLDLVFDGRWLLLAITVVAVLAGGFYLWWAAPVYRADALVQVETQRKTLNAALGEVAELLGGQTSITGEVEIIKSRMVLGKVVDALGLEIVAQRRYLPFAGRPLEMSWDSALRPAMSGLSVFGWGGEVIRISTLDLPEPLIGEPLVLRATAEGYELRDPEGATILTGQVGQMARGEWADGAVAIFLRELIARPKKEFWLMRQSRGAAVDKLLKRIRVSQRGRESGILNVTYEDTDAARATEIVNGIALAYLQQNVERRSAEAAQTLAFLNEQLPQLKQKVEAAESALNQYRLRQGSADLTKETELILEQSVALETARVEIEQKRQELLRRFTSDHPVIQALDAQRGQIGREQAAIVGHVKGLPQTQQELLRLARDVQVNTTLYTTLLNSAQELNVAKAGTVGNVRVIDYALKPDGPAKPRKKMVLALSGVLGVFLGFGAVLLRRALHRGVEDSLVVEQRTGLPTYSVIPDSPLQRRLARGRKADGQCRILAHVEPGNIAVESLRSLRASLHFGLMEARNRVLMFTGPTVGVGKSFVAINLGAVLATSGQRVVVVDADLRLGHLHEYVGIERSPGLSDFIVGSCSAEQALHQTVVPGLSLVPTGIRPPNPSELLLHDRFGQFMDQLARQFHIVLLDAPPVLAVTDAAVVGRVAGCTLLVLKAGAHPLRMIEEALRRLRHAGVEPRGTVFNQVPVHARRYGHNYAYAYEYGEATGERVREGREQKVDV
jgi:tyrosine-protein kinase Etk/Wzc